MSPQWFSGVRRSHRRWRIVVCLGVGACAVYEERELAGTRDGVAMSAQIAPPPPVPAEHVAGGAPAPAPDALAPDAPASAPACVAASELDPCDALPRLPAAPVIDGAAECGLTLHALTLPSMQPATVAYAAAWSDGGFYVYIEVHAALGALPAQPEPLYCGDAVEIFVDSDGEPGQDGDYNAPGTMQFVIGAPRGAELSTQRFVAGAPQGPWISDNLHVAPLADGYAVEALVVAADLGLWTWQPSAQLGFNLAVNLAGAGEPRAAPCTTGIGQSVLRVAMPQVDCDGKPWCDTRSFCLPALGM
jgi:hypothetical protein